MTKCLSSTTCLLQVQTVRECSAKAPQQQSRVLSLALRSAILEVLTDETALQLNSFPNLPMYGCLPRGISMKKHHVGSQIANAASTNSAILSSSLFFSTAVCSRPIYPTLVYPTLTYMEVHHVSILFHEQVPCTKDYIIVTIFTTIENPKVYKAQYQ